MTNYLKYFLQFLLGTVSYVFITLLILFIFSFPVNLIERYIKLPATPGIIIQVFVAPFVVFTLISYWFWKKSKLKFYINLVSIISAILIIIFIIFFSTNSAIVDYTDYQRRGALRDVPLALQLYFDKHGQYPDNDDLAIYMKEGTSCVTAQGQANLFEVVGVSWFTDPDQGRTYRYGVNKDGATEYVLVATFDSQKRIPVDDLDGIIFGCDCNGLNYCVGKFEASN